jgi:hypothetical protein
MAMRMVDDADPVVGSNPTIVILRRDRHSFKCGDGLMLMLLSRLHHGRNKIPFDTMTMTVFRRIPKWFFSVLR